jgi:hypothetical protein
LGILLASLETLLEKKTFELLERVQRKATKLVPSKINYNHEERLKFFQLTTLEARRIIEKIELKYLKSLRDIMM